MVNVSERPGTPRSLAFTSTNSHNSPSVNGVNGVNGHRENYKRKGEPYILEGRVTVAGITPDIVTAIVKGSGEVHDVTATADGWRCTCPARGACHVCGPSNAFNDRAPGSRRVRCPL